MPSPGPRLTEDAWDDQRPVRLLEIESDTLLPILHRTPPEDFDRATACPAWSVRDVLAHCQAALSRAATDQLNAFTPELNQLDVDERRTWPLPRLLAELEKSYSEAAPAIAAAAGRLDPLALGEWLHGGDVRDALGEPQAYESGGFDDACILLVDRTRRRATPLVEVSLPGTTLSIGVGSPDRPPASLVTGRGTLMRLIAGRATAPSDYELTGATIDELVVF